MNPINPLIHSFKENKMDIGIDEVRSWIENVQERIYDFDSKLRNNLIFYGISSEERETREGLLFKVREVIKSNLKISRELSIVSVSRVISGPEVQVLSVN